jgi:O-methyltransferase involved in polyketide biosynthesis
MQPDMEGSAIVTDSKASEQPSTDPVPDDSLTLGRTPGQRAAEIIAGSRAERTPSPITKALSRSLGRTMARMLYSMVGKNNEAGANFILVRTQGMTALLHDVLPKNKDDLCIVDIGAGFSPRGVELAIAMPKAEIIEIDLEEVVQEKRFRVSRIAGLPIPQNLSWRGADLGVTSLADILQHNRADAITAEGFLPYFARADQVRICRQIYRNLLDDGLFIADWTWIPGMETQRNAIQVFMRHGGRPAGTVNSQDDARQIFEEAGFKDITVYLPSALAETYNLPRPVNDIELIIMGRK